MLDNSSMESIQDDGYTGIVLSENDVARYRLKFGFDEHTILQYRDAFSVFDLDNDGVITANELSQVLLALGYRPSIDEVNALSLGHRQNKFSEDVNHARTTGIM
ncbi:hypothetical protein LSH36_348g02115 [Paralvinella palmiformis]|uniref:EF-hand domain-containing protein n=1 Tax=Paralvinella palmiformis TaxID=53620 RepID=A0AAD9JES0_9ANNE|nr:hypothetical protein LSH36_348g02115 [Paralvinella palmiformis]